MAKNTTFDTSDTVELKGTVSGVTRLSKKAKGVMALGGGLLMCFILFSIYTMGEDSPTQATTAAATPEEQKNAKQRNEPATAGDLTKGVSDGQAVVAAQATGPLDPNGPGALGPGFDVKPQAPAASTAIVVPGGAPASAPASTGSGGAPEGRAVGTRAARGPAPASGTIIVPAPDGSSTEVATGGAPRQPTREERMAMAAEDQRDQLARRARESGMEMDGGGWAGDKDGRTAGVSPLAGLQAESGGLFAGAAGANTGLPRAMQASGGTQDQNKQQRKEQFLKDAQTPPGSVYLKQTISASLSKYEIKAGWQIPVALEGGINTDLPGQIKARVRENVMDTATGQYLLIPQGTLAIGSYDSQIAVGQSRILVAWHRLIFPDGSSMVLEGMPGADQAGYAGLTGDVNNHYAKIFGSALMMSVISAGVQLSQPQTSTSSSQAPTSGQVIAGAVGQQLGQVSTAMIQRQMQVQPTITQEPGYRFVIQVSKDLLFPREYRAQGRARDTKVWIPVVLTTSAGSR
jgi:type IV secretory pathway VirB10-like protein